jgi:hypothetical protein
MSSEPALIDDQEFLDDLQQLVNEPPHPPVAADARARRMPENAFDALIGADNDDHLGAREGSPDRVATMWPEDRDEEAARAAWIAQAPPPVPAPSRVSPALAAIFLLVCTATGAGLSALVFHDRVAQMIALWTR